MRTLRHQLEQWIARAWSNRQGQDLIEYALAAGFVAVAALAFFPPFIAPAIKTVFSKIIDIMPTG